MAPKVDFLYPFDKGFFGSSLLAASKHTPSGKVQKAERLMDSVSDFTKHIEDMIISKLKLEKSPKSDVFEKVTNSSTFNFSDVYPGAIS